MSSPPLPAVIPHLQYTVHGSGARQWYAVRSPDKRFLRLGRSEYFVASCLDGSRTAADVLAAAHEIDGHLALREEDVLKIVSGLAKIGLIAASDAAATPVSPVAHKFSFNPVYMKLPLISGKHLERLGGWLAPMVCWPTLAAIMALWMVATVAVVANWNWFATATGRLFVADSWMWWGLAWLVLKSAHELGHAVMAVRVGSPIRSAGISLIFLAPIPYVDLSDLWTIPNRWQRILCCAGGMLVELVLAAAAALVAISTENTSLQYFGCALATMGTVTTLAFNASPLMRFDGYYIFSDLVDYPNLYTDGQQAAKQAVRKCLNPWLVAEQRMTAALVLYGLACYQYRVVMMVSLAIGTILAMQGFGVLLVAWGTYAAVLAPLLGKWHGRSRQAAGNPIRPVAGGAVSRGVAMLWSVVVVIGCCLLLMVVPAPIQPSLPGYVALRDPQVLRSETDGFLCEVYIEGGRAVENGELIARLSNPQLELELSLKRNELATVEESIRLKRAQRHLAELQAFEGELASLWLHIAQLERRVAGLEVRSTRAGILVENDLARRVGLFLNAGEPLAVIAQPRDYEVIASVEQQDVELLRQSVGSPLSAHISGGPEFEGLLAKVEPRASDKLEEPLLAAIYGGPIAVQKQPSTHGEDELKMMQPRFGLSLRLSDEHADAITPGQMVWIRMPGRPATLIDALGDWCVRKWQALVQQSRVST